MRLGVIGYGKRMHGIVTHNLRRVDPDLRIVGVVDPDERGVRERLEECDRDATFYPELDAMVREAQLDGLAIGTGCDQHAPYAVEAAQYDVPLYLEKPVAINMDQARALEDAFADSRCPVVVSFPLRTSRLCTLAREYIAEGRIGDPVHVSAVNYVPYGRVYWEDRYRDFTVTQGLFLQKATHDLDYIQYLTGKRIVRVAATWTRQKVFGGQRAAGLTCSQCEDRHTCLESPENRARNNLARQFFETDADHLCLYSVDCGDLETGTNEDCSSCLFQFADGSHGTYTQNFFIRHCGSRGARISGYMGTVAFDWVSGTLTYTRHHDLMQAEERSVSEKGGSHFGGDIVLAREMIDLMAGRKKASVSPIEAGIQSVYACLACKASAEQEVFVDVPQVGGRS